MWRDLASRVTKLALQSVMGAEISDQGKREQKNQARSRSHSYERNIDDAMQLLAAAAVFAFGKMQFVVAPHFRGNAGNVIAPSREDLPYDGVHTLTHKTLEPKRL